MKFIPEGPYHLARLSLYADKQEDHPLLVATEAHPVLMLLLRYLPEIVTTLSESQAGHRLLTCIARQGGETLRAMIDPASPPLPWGEYDFAVSPPETRRFARMADRAKLRPSGFDRLPPQEQWVIDKALGILDWDGDPKR